MCVVQYLFTCVHVTTGSLDDAVAQRKANNTKQKRNVWDEEVNIGHTCLVSLGPCICFAGSWQFVSYFIIFSCLLSVQYYGYSLESFPEVQWYEMLCQIIF